MLQCVAVCCSVLSVIQCVAVCRGCQDVQRDILCCVFCKVLQSVKNPKLKNTNSQQHTDNNRKGVSPFQVILLSNSQYIYIYIHTYMHTHT